MLPRAGAFLSSTLSRAGWELKVPSIKEQQALCAGSGARCRPLVGAGTCQGLSAQEANTRLFSSYTAGMVAPARGILPPEPGDSVDNLAGSLYRNCQ
jgi:hypothetical protein